MTQPGSGFGLGSPPGGYGGSPLGGSGPSGGYGPPDGPSILGGGGPVPAGGGRPTRKKGSGGLIGLVVLALLVLGGIVALIVVLLLKKGGAIAADPSSLPAKQASVAYKHLPPGCDVVLRANAAQMLEVPAVKTHLLPVLEEMQSGAGTDPDAKAIEDLFRSAGIDARTDLKDAAMCLKGLSGPRSERKFVVVIGGDLRPETAVNAWEKVDRRSREKPVLAKADGRIVGRSQSQAGEAIVAGQASDAAIVVSNDEALFAAAMKESSAYESEYALPTGPEVAIVVGATTVRDAVAQGGPNPFLKDVAAISRVVGTASLKDAKSEVRLATPSPQSAKSLLDLYSLMLGPMMKQELARQKGRAPGMEILMNAKPSVDGNDFVLSAQGSPADVDAAAKELARMLREERKKHGL